MISQLLSSKPKAKLVNLFLAHPSRSFSFTELKVASGCPKNLLKKTLVELSKSGFLNVHTKKVKYYQINRHFALYPELVNLLRKVKNPPHDLLAKSAARIGDCKLIVLTGVFVGRPRIETDLLFVGKVSAKRLQTFLRIAEKFAEQEVSFTLLTPSEFDYRKIMNDRFLKNVLENDPVIVIDRTRNRSVARLKNR